MENDIQLLSRKIVVGQEITEMYSILTCRCCKNKAEFKGVVTNTIVPGGWTQMSLRGNQNGVSCYEWLLCPDCTQAVRTTAGL
jgi:hypothetical protein